MSSPSLAGGGFVQRLSGLGSHGPKRLSMLASPWLIGLLVAIATWDVAFRPPIPGLDPSWIAGLYLAAHRGLHFGTQVVFTYGPLGFLAQPSLWFGDLATLAFIYGAVLHLLVCLSLVWALQRTLHPLLALLAAAGLVATGAQFDTSVVLAGIWCLAALAPEVRANVIRVVVYGLPVLAALEVLIYLRSGSLVAVIGVLTVLALPGWRRNLALFGVIGLATFALLWFVSGQTLSNLPDFLGNSLQIISGYSDAMGVQAVWSGYRWIAILVSLIAVVVVWMLSAPGRPRVGAVAIAALTMFTLFKEGNVRAESGHTLIFFTSTAVLAGGFAFGYRRALAILLVLIGVAGNVHMNHIAQSKLSYSPVAHARRMLNQLGLLFDPGKRDETSFFFAARMIQQYGLPNAMRTLLDGHTVQVAPWEVGAAWAYGLDWAPAPVIQDYSAYTSHLDGIEAARLRGRQGPQRILLRVPDGASGYPLTSIDYRLAAWDPPGKALAMLCHYVPLATNPEWEVLGKGAGRCGRARRVASMNVRFGQTVTLPAEGNDEVLYARLHGIEVAGLERLRSLLFRAKFRYAVLDGTRSYRLVPDTAADGLVLDAPAGADYPRPFTLAPQAHTLAIKGLSGSYRIDLFAMTISPRH